MKRTMRTVVSATKPSSAKSKSTRGKSKLSNNNTNEESVSEDRSKVASKVSGGGKRTSNKIAKNEPEVSPYFATGEESAGTKLGSNFYNQGTVQLAKALLGKVLCRKLPETGQILKGTIVETEAYPGEGDAASHSYKGVPTPASMPMFMDPGTAYVYLTYGMYHCFNVSSKDNGGACLFRAAEVLEDYEIMHHFRRPRKKKLEETNSSAGEEEKRPEKKLKPHELANGPAKLCLAFDITRDACNKVDMISSDNLWLEVSHNEMYRKGDFEVEVSKRVGIDSTPPEARNQPYRFFIKDNPSVSKAKFKDDVKTRKNKSASSRSSKRSKK